MKHIKKKFLNSHTVTDDVINIISSATVNEQTIAELRRTNFDGHYAILQTDGNELIHAFQYIKNNNIYFIPEPNPIVIYFEVGRYYYRQIAKAQQTLFEELNQAKPDAYKTLNNFYIFYTNASVCTTFLFNSIEAFINNLIPKEFTYSKVTDKKTEVYDKFQIQRHLQFEEKIKSVLPIIKGNSFHKEQSHKYAHINKLKEFRDEIMHTKSYDKTNPNFYKNLFTLSLDFDYAVTLFSVRDFINFYEPNLIEECDCGNDW